MQSLFTAINADLAARTAVRAGTLVDKEAIQTVEHAKAAVRAFVRTSLPIS